MDVTFPNQPRLELNCQQTVTLKSGIMITLITAFFIPSLPGQVPNQLPDTDQNAVDPTKPVKAYIMLGQSNMLGFGKVGPIDTPGTLEYLAKVENRYPHLVDDDGGWTQRGDVRYVHVMQRRGTMSVIRNEWLIPNGKFGPELGFGHVVGYIHDAPVLLLKACIGNRSLGWDLLPPGSDRFEFEGKFYAGYKESPLSWPKGTEPEPISWYAGKQYDDDVANAKAVLANLAEFYPDFRGNVQSIDARPFWHEADVSPNKKQGYHYFHHAGNYMEVGDALGRAMADLLQPNQ